MVAYPDRTAFFGDYFRVGGDSPGITDCDFQALNACIGDLTGTERMPSIAI
jgi:hypothetical protein